ncbi:uncharacterized protein LOC124789305 [Schistocerca piceifrons]|uniref:uncharacterized protein LOC124789305 n=1 Tax=Schistocerca piceifrons TaxID=274613 RepID=UPI001F5F112C|nr:uncharacterized protein LOC124789305 [Schistocerca piceifrons]
MQSFLETGMTCIFFRLFGSVGYNIKMSNLSGHTSVSYESDFIQLTELAGIKMQPEIIRVLLELLSMNIHPTSIYTILRHLCARHGQKARAAAACQKLASKSKK